MSSTSTGGAAGSVFTVDANALIAALLRGKALPIIALPESFYSSRVPQARDLIARRDPNDVDIPAPALRLQIPVWTNDRHVQGLSGVQAATTAQLLARLPSTEGPDKGRTP